MEDAKRTTESDRALIVEDDPAVLEMMRAVLKADGFDVMTASTGEQALELAHDRVPDVILLDIMMPGSDGMSVCRRLRHDFTTRNVCIVMVTARASIDDKLVGFRAGADDYVTKPFDPEELIGRVRAAIRRSRDRTSLNPLTELPGNSQIHQTVKDALAWEEPFALLHVDIDGFKAFNDHYNVLRGDEAIKLLAACIGDAVKDLTSIRLFIGHVGGDDFAIILEAPLAEKAAARIIELWGERMPGLYDEEDRKRGFIRVRDRQKRTTRFPLMTLSIGVASSAHRRFATYLEAADIASEMKEVAKQDPGSSFAIDRRHEMPVPPKDMRDPRSVLIVDDWAEMRTILRLHCEHLGFTVVAEADNGVAAIELTLRHLPAFVIMDQRMPRMDGAGAAQAIRAAVKDVRIIAFTAFLDEKPDWADEFLRKEQINELTPMLGKLLEEKLGRRRPSLATPP